MEAKPHDAPTEYADSDPPVRRPPVPPLPVWLVVAAAIFACVMIKYVSGMDGAKANIFVLILAFVALMTLGVWFTFFSGLPTRLRQSVCGVVVLGVVVFLVVYEMEGTDGWMIPRFVPRFRQKPDELLARPETTGDSAQPLVGVDLITTTPDDFPRFLGPAASNAVEGPRLAADWNKQQPKLRWKQKIGAGWSAFSAVNGFAVTMEQRGPLEMVTCYELHTGTSRWSQSIKARFETIMGGIGPRATPTIDGGQVFTLGAKGDLQCLDGVNGEVVWGRNVVKDCEVSPEEDAKNVYYGRSGSPLVVDEMVIVPGGGSRDGTRHSLLAYDRHNGNVIWKGGDRQIAYSSPTLVTLVATRQILIVNENAASGHDLTTGSQLWKYNWPARSSMDPNVSQAVPIEGDRVFLSNGYNNGAALIQITYSGGDGWHARKIWQRATAMRTKFTNVVIRDGFVYGLSDGILECLDLKDGQRRWKKGRYGHGQILRVGGSLLVLTEYGDLVLIELSSERLIERGRMPVLEGKTWNNLCLFGNLLLVRNGTEAACLELPLAEAD